MKSKVSYILITVEQVARPLDLDVRKSDCPEYPHEYYDPDRHDPKDIRYVVFEYKMGEDGLALTRTFRAATTALDGAIRTANIHGTLRWKEYPVKRADLIYDPEDKGE